MDSGTLNQLDWVILAVLAASSILGVWRGVVKEVFSVAGWIAGFIFAFRHAADAGQVRGFRFASQTGDQGGFRRRRRRGSWIYLRLHPGSGDRDGRRICRLFHIIP